MNLEAQRIAIGEICGFTLDQWKDMLKEKGIIGYRRNNLYYSVLPDYLNDLNAMHEAEKVLTYDQHIDYMEAATSINATAD